MRASIVVVLLIGHPVTDHVLAMQEFFRVLRPALTLIHARVEGGEAPTLDALRTSIQKIEEGLTGAHRADIYVYYAGQGRLTHRDKRPVTELLLEGEETLWISELIEPLRRIAGARVHVIVDACESYYALESRGEITAVKRRAKKLALEEDDDSYERFVTGLGNVGAVLKTSCEDPQTVFDPATVFDGDRAISYRELLKRTRDDSAVFAPGGRMDETFFGTPTIEPAQASITVPAPRPRPEFEAWYVDLGLFAEGTVFVGRELDLGPSSGLGAIATLGIDANQVFLRAAWHRADGEAPEDNAYYEAQMFEASLGYLRVALEDRVEVKSGVLAGAGSFLQELDREHRSAAFFRGAAILELITPIQAGSRAAGSATVAAGFQWTCAATCGGGVSSPFVNLSLGAHFELGVR